MALDRRKMSNETTYIGDNPCPVCGSRVRVQETRRCASCNPVVKNYAWLEGKAKLRQDTDDLKDRLKNEREKDPYYFGED